ncbi:MAG TPA: hypothetical protein VFW22_00740 [Pseudolabrys sp.]|nr:hypothetical protein [Pseudolabrys sp.]
MTVRHIGSGLVLALLGLAGLPTQGHALAICVDSKELAIQQSECIRRGAAVMSKYFGQSKHDAGAIFGFQGKDNAAAILCDRAAKGVVFFTVASTDESFCRPNIMRLMNEF